MPRPVPCQSIRLAFLLVPLLSPAVARAASISLTNGNTATHDDLIMGTYGTDNLTVDGPGSALNTQNFFFNGYYGGVTTITNGGVVNATGTTELGSGTPTRPTLWVDGVGSAWNASFAAILDTASVLMTNGAIGNGGGLNVGSYITGLPGTSSLTLDGAGTALTLTGGLNVGIEAGAPGTLVLRNGAVLSNGETRAGYYRASHADITVDGPGSAWQSTGDLYLANRGSVNFTISNGAAVTNTASMYLGYGSDVPGVQPCVATLTGPGSSLSAAALYFGGPVYGTGTLTVSDHATLTASQNIEIRNSPGCRLTLIDGTISTPVLDVAGSFDMTGGTLLATQITAGPNFHATGGTIRLPFGGSLAVPAAGLTIGATLVNGGTVAGPTSPAARLDLTGPVSGPGNFTGRVAFASTFSPGDEDTVATVSFDAATFLPSDTLTMDLLIPSYSDHLLFASASILGGALTLHPLSGFSPVAGDTFPLFTGPLAGTFDHLNLPLLPNNLFWNTSALYTDGTLSVVPEPGTIAACLGLFPFLRRGAVSRSFESRID